MPSRWSSFLRCLPQPRVDDARGSRRAGPLGASDCGSVAGVIHVPNQAANKRLLAFHDPRRVFAPIKVLERLRCAFGSFGMHSCHALVFDLLCWHFLSCRLDLFRATPNSAMLDLILWTGIPIRKLSLSVKCFFFSLPLACNFLSHDALL